MSRQYFMDVNAEAPIANQTAVTATVETSLWVVPQFTPINAYELRPGKIYRLCAGGIMSFAATGTLIITPRFGTTTGGVTMGANVNAQTTPGTTTANAWYMQFDMVCRTIGPSGSNSSVIGTGFFTTGATGTAGTSVSFAFGGTSAAVDYTTAAGLFIGWTLSVAGTVTPQFIHWQSLN